MLLKTKSELAEDLLREIFAEHHRIAIAEVVERGKEIGVSRRTLMRVASQIGVREIHNGPFPAFWQFG